MTLRIACSDTFDRRALLEQLARDWSARTGARIELLPSGTSTGPAPDIWVMPVAEMPAWAAKGELQEVPDTIRGSAHKYQWAQLPAAYAQKLLRWGGKPYALPLVGEGHILVYRADLFAEQQQRYEAELKKPLTPPATWDDYVRIAQFFKAVTKGKPSLPPLPATPEGLDRLFFTIAAPYDRPLLTEGTLAKERKTFSTDTEDEFSSFHYSLASGEPRIAKPAFAHALALLRQMQPCRAAPATVDPAEAFQSGQAVLMLAPLDAVARFQKDSNVRDRFAIAPIPGAGFTFDYRTDVPKQLAEGAVNRLPYLGWGSIVGTVLRGCQNADVAWSFLADAGNPVSTSVELIGAATWGAGPTRLTHLEDQSRNAWLGYGLSAQQTNQLVEQLRLSLAPGVANYRVRLRTPDERAHLLALDKGIREALLSNEPPQIALEKVAERWRELDKAQGKSDAERRETYRKSLGGL